MRAAVLVALVIALNAIAGPPANAELRVEARLDRTRIFSFEQAVLTVRVHGVRSVEPPVIEVPGLHVEYRGGGESSSTQMTIINGRTTMHEALSFTMQYVLTPKTAGRFDIPPIKVMHDGTEYTGPAPTLHVEDPPPQPYVILEQEVEPASPFIEQPVTVRLKVFIRKIRSGDSYIDEQPLNAGRPPGLEIPWLADIEGWQTGDINELLQPLLLRDGEAGFTINGYGQRGFFGRSMLYQFRLEHSMVERAAPDGQVLPYHCYTLERRFRPGAVGMRNIEPSVFRGMVPADEAAMGRIARPETVVAMSNRLEVQVRPVPSEGKPADFSGAVGDYVFAVDASPKAASVGDPIDLILTVTGGGLLERILPPDLSAQKKLNEKFKVYGDAPVTKVDGDTKVFRYTIRANDETVTAVPPLSFSYFDVTAGEYRTVWSKPVPVSIKPTARLTLSEIEESGGVSRSWLGRELSGGLLANYSGQELLADQTFSWGLSPGLLVILLLPPVAVCVAAVVGRNVSRRRSDVAFTRSRNARKAALARLRELARTASAIPHAEFCGELSKVFTHFIADKLNLPREGTTTDDVRCHLASILPGDPVIESLDELILRCDSGRFGADAAEQGGDIAGQRNEMLETARRIIDRLERAIKK